jgi:spore germination protein
MGVSEAKDEQVIRGSSEGFSSSYKTNELLVRKRIRTPELKIEELKIGVKSNTGLALLYMDTVVRKDMLDEIKRRLSEFTIDGFMDSGIIEQLTNDNEYSPFPQYMTTERPDRAAQLVLDGHIVILVDNSPIALAMPVNFATFLKTADDYYSRWELVSLERILRYIAMFFSFSLPALYISVVNFQPEILPTNLVLIFIKARQFIPYPVFVEVIIMEIAFELIREAGVRIPGAMGNAIGIVGGLIVGSAAVEASLASPIVVIVVALTALCSFTIPNNEFSSAFRLIKYFMIIMSSLMGIYGYILGTLLVMIHLSGLVSYGFPYLGPIAAGDMDEGEGEKDFIIRAPSKFLTKRPIFANDSNRCKQRVRR